MARIMKDTNWRVVARMAMHNANDPKWAPRYAAHLKESIVRHCDVGPVEVVWDSEATCSLCNGEWELDEDGWPRCCNAALDEYIAAAGRGSF